MNAFLKKRSFKKMLFENPVPLHARLGHSLDLSLLTKWPVSLQNTSGNPIQLPSAFNSIKACYLF